jgi:hypothetical protein
MTEHKPVTGSEHLDERLEDLAEELRRPHDDDQARREAQRAAGRAGSNPRRQGKQPQAAAGQRVTVR